MPPETSADLETLIPAELRPKPHLVPATENAVSNWLFATENLIRPKSTDNSVALSEFRRFRMDAAIPAAQRTLFREHVTTNNAALTAFAAGIEQGSFSREGVTNRFNLAALKSLIELRNLETRFLIEEGSWAEAGSRLLADLQVPQMLNKDSRGLIDFLLSLAFQGVLNEQILSLADNPETPSVVLRSLGDRIHSVAIGRSDLLRAYRHTAYEQLTNTESAARFFTSPTELQSGLRNLVLNEELGEDLPDLLLDPELMRRHPQPLDLAKTISIQAEHFAETLKALENPSEQLDLEFFTRETTARLMADCHKLIEAGENLETPLSPEEADQLATLYRKIENPVGQLMMTFDPIDTFPRVEQWLRRLQTTTKITRLAIELTLFHREQGRWPRTLQELPAVETAPDLASDPHTGSHFRYSADAKRVWSVTAENSKPGAIPEARTNRVRGLTWPTLPD